MRAFRLPLVLVLTSLAGCASQPSPAPSPLPAPAISQQPSAPEPSFTQTGLASFYGRAHDGKVTASGESFNPEDLTAAHRTLALGSRVRVTNLENGEAVTVKITDRGPFVRGRIIDLSLAAARALGMTEKGVTRVRLEAVGANPTGKQSPPAS
jgi:rare lipoprotein A